MRQVLRSKIHRATVTEANPDYVGSITIDQELMESVGLWPGEKVLVASVDTGQRLETYTLKGDSGSGVICLNGAAAKLIKKDSAEFNPEKCLNTLNVMFFWASDNQTLEP